jgi:hypothetical protein
MKSKSPEAVPRRNSAFPLPPPEGGESGTLNVIFHGTFLFFLNKKTQFWDKRDETFYKEGIQILIPEVSGHVYRAGNWLGEMELASGRNSGMALFTLEGVAEGTQFLDKRQNLVFESKPLAKDLNRKLRATIHVPKPHKVTSLCRLPMPAKDVLAADKNNQLPKQYGGQIATLQIFTYRIEDDAALRLVQRVPGHSSFVWEPAFAGQGEDRTVNLHIFAAHEGPAGSAHVPDAFDSLMNLFAGVHLKLPRPRRGFSFKKSELPRGVDPEETEDLAPRTQRLAQLGRMKLEERDLNLAWFDREGFGTGDPPDACLNGGGRG